MNPISSYCSCYCDHTTSVVDLKKQLQFQNWFIFTYFEKEVAYVSERGGEGSSPKLPKNPTRSLFLHWYCFQKSGCKRLESILNQTACFFNSLSECMATVGSRSGSSIPEQFEDMLAILLNDSCVQEALKFNLTVKYQRAIRAQTYVFQYLVQEKP